jgi:hypothetical protein
MNPTLSSLTYLIPPSGRFANELTPKAQTLPTDDRISYPRSIGFLGIAALRSMLIDLDYHWLLIACRTICRNGHIFNTGKINCDW